MVIEKLGRYLISSELGQGAMGVVYKAVDPLIDRTVAIKTINLDLSKDELENFERRFQREVQSAGRLSHPNIVTIYDMGKAEGVAYMAMEFLEGKELREILDSGAVLPIEKIAHIGAQVAEGLAFAHEHGVVHRDIKPSNIMILRSGMAKITDFGIAQMSSGSRTMAGMVLGSPKYMSPEQVVGQPVDGRSDIFSLGAVLYEMLTGRPPFNGDNISSIMYQVLNEMPPAPRMLNQGIPESIDYIVMKTLAKHPDERYQSARELARDLRKYKTWTLPAAGNETGAHPTLERRAAPRNDPSDVTQILGRFSDSLLESGGNPELTIATEIQPAPWWKTRLLFYYGLIPALVIAFALTVIFGKPSEPPAASAPQPQVKQEKTAPAAVENPAPLAVTPQVETAEKTVARHEPRKKTATAPANKAQPAEHGTPGTGSATLSFAISPWGEVYIDSEKQGVSPPLKELKIAPGKHAIMIVNGSFPPYSKNIELEPGATQKIKYKFN